MAIKEFFVARLHVDLGLWEASIKKNKPAFIKDCFFTLSRKNLYYVRRYGEAEIAYSIAEVEEINDQFIKGKIIRTHPKFVKRLSDPESKEIIEEKIDGVVEYVEFYYNLPSFLMFVEEKRSYGLTKKRIATIVSILLREVIKSKENIEAEVDLVFLASEKEFVKKVLSLQKLLYARFILFPTNPSPRIYEDLEKDLRDSNVEKRLIVDRPKPGESLDYKKESSFGRKSLQMVEDGYGKGKVRGIDQNGALVILDSEERSEKVSLDSNQPMESIISTLLQKITEIWNKFKPKDSEDDS